MPQLLPMALGSAVYPTLLAVVILILTQPNPRRLLAAYLAGALLTSLSIGLVIIRGLNSGHVLNGSSGRSDVGIRRAGAGDVRDPRGPSLVSVRKTEDERLRSKVEEDLVAHVVL